MKTFILATIIAFFALSSHSFAQEKSLKPIENYLSSLKTMVADFKQVAPDGTVSTGKFHLKRPKQMRWQYNPPTPILMVTRGNYLTYYDYDLNQVSDIPLEDTLLGVLSQKQISFNDPKIAVAENYEQDGLRVVTFLQKEQPDNGSLSMVFDQKPAIALRQLILVDATQQTTSITFANRKENTEVTDKVFKFKDPRTGGKRNKLPKVRGGF